MVGGRALRAKLDLPLGNWARGVRCVVDYQLSPRALHFQTSRVLPSRRVCHSAELMLECFVLWGIVADRFQFQISSGVRQFNRLIMFLLSQVFALFTSPPC